MYISNLVENHGYRIVFKKGERKGSYFGVNTSEKMIYLLNTRQSDIKTIEKLLLHADLYYSKKRWYV